MRKSFKRFIESFRKLDNRLLNIVLFDLIFWLIAIFSYNLLASYLKKNYVITGKSVEAVSSMTDISQNYAAIQGHYAVVDSFVKGSIGYSIILIISLFLLWGFFRCLMWSIILKKDFSFKSLKRFWLLNLVWQPFNLIIVIVFTVILGGIVFLSNRNLTYLYTSGLPGVIVQAFYILILLLIVFPIALYIVNLTNILYIFFIRNKKIKIAVKDMLETSILKFKQLYVICLYMSSILLVLLFLLLFLQKISQTFYLITSLVVFVLFFSWSKFYLVNLMD